MNKSVKNLRHPIQIEINGTSITLVTVGYCTTALGRTSACLKQWESIGLFPSAPYRLGPNRLRLYPLDFVKAIARIKEEGYMGRRMDRPDWRRFQLAVWNAHDAALAPLKSEVGGVVERWPDDGTGEGRQG
jgi:hypothetical protein